MKFTHVIMSLIPIKHRPCTHKAPDWYREPMLECSIYPFYTDLQDFAKPRYNSLRIRGWHASQYSNTVNSRNQVKYCCSHAITTTWSLSNWVWDLLGNSANTRSRLSMTIVTMSFKRFAFYTGVWWRFSALLKSGLVYHLELWINLFQLSLLKTTTRNQWL